MQEILIGILSVWLSATHQSLGMNENLRVTTGMVISMNPSDGTCDVRLTAGGILYGAPVMNSVGGKMSTDSGPIPNLVQATVLLMQIQGTWYIMGTLPQREKATKCRAVSATNTETGAENKQTYGRAENKSPANYTGGRSLSSQPGDKLLSTDGGSEVFLGAEGLAILKASPLAQLILGAHKDFAKLVAREIEFFTDFGQVSFTGGGDSGKASLSILGGAGFCDESSPTDPVYPVKIFLGDVPGDPTARASIFIGNAEGSQFVHIVLDNTGSMHMQTSADFEERIWGDKATLVEGNQTHFILGDQTYVIGENPNQAEEEATEIQNPRRGEASGNRTTVIKKDETLTVEQNRTATIKEDDNLTVEKNRTTEAKQTLTVKSPVITVAAGSISVTSYTGESLVEPMEVKTLPINLVRA